jgi:hypothetical protein
MSEAAVWQCTNCGRSNNPTLTVCAPCGTSRSDERGTVESAIAPSHGLDFDIYNFPIWSYIGIGVATTMILGLIVFVMMMHKDTYGSPTSADWVAGILLFLSIFLYPIQVFVVGIFYVLRLAVAYPTPKHLLGTVTFALYIPIMSLSPYFWMRAWWDDLGTGADLFLALALNMLGPIGVAVASILVTKKLLT